MAGMRRLIGFSFTGKSTEYSYSTSLLLVRARVLRGSRLVGDESAHRVLLLLVRAPTIGKRLHDSYFMIDMYYVSNPPTFEFPKRRALWLLEITAEKLLSVQGLTSWSIGRDEPDHRVLLFTGKSTEYPYSTSLLLVRAPTIGKKTV